MSQSVYALLYQNFRGNDARLDHRTVRVLHRMYGVEATRHFFPQFLSLMDSMDTRPRDGGVLAFCVPSLHPSYHSLSGFRSVGTRIEQYGGVCCLYDRGRPGAQDVSLPRITWPHLRVASLCFHRMVFLHSDSIGSPFIGKSPTSFAAFCVLLRLQPPRHPPFALFKSFQHESGNSI